MKQKDRHDPKEERKGKPLVAELDLGGKFSRGNMLRPSLENGKEAHVVILDNFKHQEDVKMYIQLPDYDDFQCYDSGLRGTLSHIARKIYANFKKPSWRTLKHHLFSAEIAKKLFRDLDAISGNGKMAISHMGECLEGYQKYQLRTHLANW